MRTYYFTAATEHFLLEEDPVEEILRERLRFYKDNNLSIDFWLTQTIDTLNISELNSLQKEVPEKLVAIISTNPKFIDWLKLRLQYVINGHFSVSNDIELMIRLE
uniref:hypothetical protein n=1 Tax=Goniotrichopsis reniformis TaxID=468933 RepID=UPI001FCCD510|nr:hypothetical protein MW428_pgp087 [Goniotrichopsis reniformis]UNJ14811.1 hypothetical protein [Goniotrichopsis reniformis]